LPDRLVVLYTAPFLPVREDFHPKRNQARQKLATLPKNRFKDLGSDVYFELKRRWPEFAEDVQASGDKMVSDVRVECKLMNTKLGLFFAAR
jgi:hypothetical protein